MLSLKIMISLLLISLLCPVLVFAETSQMLVVAQIHDPVEYSLTKVHQFQPEPELTTLSHHQEKYLIQLNTPDFQNENFRMVLPTLASQSQKVKLIEDEPIIWQQSIDQTTGQLVLAVSISTDYLEQMRSNTEQQYSMITVYLDY